MKKYSWVLIVFSLIAISLSAADFKIKVTTEEVGQVAVTFIETVSDELAVGMIRKQLKTGNLTMDMNREGSSFNKNYSTALYNKVKIEGDEAKVTMILSLMNSAGEEIGQWTLENAWPSKIHGPSMRKVREAGLVISFKRQ